MAVYFFPTGGRLTTQQPGPLTCSWSSVLEPNQKRKRGSVMDRKSSGVAQLVREELDLNSSPRLLPSLPASPPGTAAHHHLVSGSKLRRKNFNVKVSFLETKLKARIEVLCAWRTHVIPGYPRKETEQMGFLLCVSSQGNARLWRRKRRQSWMLSADVSAKKPRPCSWDPPA